MADSVLQSYREQKQEILQKIAELQKENELLDRLIARRLNETQNLPPGQVLTKKNANQRRACTRICELLEGEPKRGLKTGQIYEVTKLLFFALKEPTFRHYLHWMRKHKLIFKKIGGREWYVYPNWKETLSRIGAGNDLGEAHPK